MATTRIEAIAKMERKASSIARHGLGGVTITYERMEPWRRTVINRLEADASRVSFAGREELANYIRREKTLADINI